MIIIQTHEGALTGIKKFVPNGFVTKIVGRECAVGVWGWSLGFWNRGKEQTVTDSKFIDLNL
mgnify:CR=1 FL=1